MDLGKLNFYPTKVCNLETPGSLGILYMCIYIKYVYSIHTKLQYSVSDVVSVIEKYVYILIQNENNIRSHVNGTKCKTMTE